MNVAKNSMVPMNSVLLFMLLLIFVYMGAVPVLAIASSRPTFRAATGQHAKQNSIPARTNNDRWPGLLFYDRRRLRFVFMRKKVRRTREEIQREQAALREKTEREIDAIVAEFHKKLPREKAKAIGAAYARFSTRYQDSIADQIRTIFEAALREGIFIPRELVFYDLAVRGGKSRRPGLDALKQALERKLCQVFLVFNTSRLFRRAYMAMQFVEEELVDRGIRAIFVKSNIDTFRGDEWRLLFQALIAHDEYVSRMYGAHVIAAHEGLFIRLMICTSLILGYTGKEIAGELTKRKLPRRSIIIDPETAPWIEKIFHWYVVEAKGLDEMARILNSDPEAPVPAKSKTGIWTRIHVRRILQHPAYRGWWEYGRTKSRWLNKKDYAKQELRPEPLKSGQFEHLRIVSDDLWFRAQQLLAAERSNAGRKAKDGDRASRPKGTRKLFHCPTHDRQLVPGGPGGRILFCPVCRAIEVEVRPLFTHLNRKLAHERTCQVLGELVRADDELPNAIIAACQQATENAQKPDPSAKAQLQAKADKLAAVIRFNRENPGDGDQQQRQTKQLVDELARQQTDVLAELARLDAATKNPILIPSAAEVAAYLDDLGELLAFAASADAGIASDKQRMAERIIEELTGGRILLFQMGERKRGHGWLQGRFTVDMLSLAVAKLTGAWLQRDASNHLEVVIDYRKPKLMVQQSEEAKALWDLGYLNKEIAKLKNWKRSYVTKLINYWFDSRGLPRPDGRRRRAQLPNKQETLPVYKQLADKVMSLVEHGLSNLRISAELKVSDATVAKAIAWWHESRQLPMPSAEDRRRKQLARARVMYLAGVLLRDIAAQIGYSPRGLKLALKKYFDELGEEMPDGRTRRGNADSGAVANGQPPETEPPDKPLNE